MISHTWKNNDKVTVELPMEVKRVVCIDSVKDNQGKVALQRGPIIYCAEWADNNGKAGNIILPRDSKFITEYRPDLLNGIMTIKTEVPVVTISENENISTSKRTMTAIPYYSWANRGVGEMTIWFPYRVQDIEIFSGKIK